MYTRTVMMSTKMRNPVTMSAAMMNTGPIHLAVRRASNEDEYNNEEDSESTA
jgi:hypothetical protein